MHMCVSFSKIQIAKFFIQRELHIHSKLFQLHFDYVFLQFNTDMAIVGIIFGIWATCYSLSCPITTFIVNKVRN